MNQEATPAQIDEVVARIEEHEMKALRLPGGDHIAIGVASAIPPDLREPLTVLLSSLPGVDHVVQISRPYKLASREFHRVDTVINIKGVEIGGNRCVVMAGPCSVESRDQIFATARAVQAAGAVALRGGAYKPRTSPYAFPGLGEEALEIMAQLRERTGMRIVTEAIDHEALELVVQYADVIQIGARNMQNYSLLRAAGRKRKPVLLKRGMAATLDELLMAAEYIMSEGNYEVILCERGVRTFTDHTRNTLDLSIVPAVQRLSHLPIVVDPSHGTGKRDKVIPMGRAAVAAGADGLIVEVHDQPDKALSDGAQSIYPEQFQQLVDESAQIATILGRHVPRGIKVTADAAR